MKYIKRILKILIFATIAFIFGFAIFRVLFLDNEGAAKDIIWTPEAIEIYNSEQTFPVSFFQPEEYLTADGYVTVVEPRYLEKTHQLEFTVRYRNSNFEKLKESLGFSPEDSGHLEYMLTVTDKSGGEKVVDYLQVDSTKYFYNYNRLVFDGIFLDNEELVNVALNIFYVSADGSSVSYEGLKLYGSTSVRVDYDYSKELPIKEYSIVSKTFTAS